MSGRKLWLRWLKFWRVWQWIIPGCRQRIADSPRPAQPVKPGGAPAQFHAGSQADIPG
ncbi:hypothetical protein L21SP2_2297 [Salinispira pacifica]|uniref:Uncharacterized protein n=1 Tax=Salinispira pacifica TaxID=1307761 RepID=V5WJC9_9SPIO|nr:hypothetical protein L21SP2_2297 [Salinispira pacifica]